MTETPIAPAVPKPLAHPNEDVSFLEAREALHQFTTASDVARNDVRLTDIAKGEQIKAAYDKYTATVSDAYKGLMQRRQDRLTHLEGMFPVGPGVPAGTSPADSAVLMTAFRTAYAEAQNAPDAAARAKLLAQAERFGDDTLRRAVFTALIDNNEHNAANDWAAKHIDQPGYLSEVAELRDAVAGRGMPHLWDVQTFGAVPEPKESKALPRLIDQAQADQAAQRHPGVITHRNR